MGRFRGSFYREAVDFLEGQPPIASGFVRGIPILQRGDRGILIIGSEADQGAAEQENRDEYKPVAITDLVGIDIHDKKVNKKRRGETESSHGNALDKQKPVLHYRKILGYTLVGKQ
jgi:hypothetical protein